MPSGLKMKPDMIQKKCGKNTGSSTCYDFSDNVQFRWKPKDGEEKTVIPDATINCRVKVRKGNTFLDIPRFVMEVLSPSTEKYDRGEKKELYRQPQYYLWKVITESNKEELKIVHFPKVEITFEKIFSEVDLDY